MKLFRKKREQPPVRQPHITDANESYTFRRSRTMTGSLSSTVLAASERFGDLKSNRQKHHELKKQRRWLFGGFLIVVIMGVSLYMLLAQFMTSVTVVVTGAPHNLTTAYADTIQKYISARPSERFIFALNHDTLLTYVQHDYPEISGITVTHAGLFQPGRAEITLREPVASWTVQGKRFYIDNHGVQFTTHIGAEPTLIVEDKTGIDPNSTGAIASERMIHYIGRLVALLGEKGYQVEKLELPLLTSREVDVYLQGRAYRIKTSVDRDPAGQAMDVENIVAYLEKQSISPTYVDARVSSRAYYR